MEEGCPHCGAGMAENAVVCLECGFDHRIGEPLQLDLETAPDPSLEQATPAPSVEPSTFRKLLPLLLLIVVGVGWALIDAYFGSQLRDYFFPQPNVVIHFDNGTEKPLTFFIDREKKAEVQPGQYARIECRSGERHLKITEGETIVWSETRELQPPLRPGEMRSYVANPESARRYVIMKTTYASRLFQPPETNRLFISDSELRRLYKDLLRDVTFLEPEPWFEPSKRCDFVLGGLPNEIHGPFKEQKTITKYALRRISEADYEKLQAAQSRSNITSADYEELVGLINRTLQ